MGWILRFILLIVVIWVVFRFLGGIIDGISGGGSRGRSRVRHRSGGGPGGGAASVPLVRDPICGTYVVREKALTAGSGDRMQYFCSEKCRDEFARRA